jgi:hypothetical protein
MTETGRTSPARRSAWRLVVALSTLALAPASLLGAPPAGAATTGACPDASGVTVVVDFHELGGGIVVRCAGSSVRSGAEALAQAGFTVTEPLRTPGFVCRIEGKPGADREACVDTPPTSAYWSYWRADRGGSWTYSSQGASATRPAQVEGWSFALDRSATAVPPPGIAPPPLPPPPTSALSRSAPPPTTVAGHAATNPGRVRGPSVTAAVAGVTTTRPGGPSPASSTVPDTATTREGAAAPGSTTARNDATTTTARGRIEVANADATSTPAGGGSGPGAGALVAVVLIGALVAGAVVRSRRRSTASSASADGP